MQSTKRQTMWALARTAYGSPAEVLRLGEVDSPTIGDDDVLVRVHASSVNPADWHTLTGTPYLIRPQMGLRQPKRPTLGLDVAGRVEAVGPNVRLFEPGDEVYGEVEGAFAAQAVADEKTLAPKPANLSYEEAAAVPVAGLTALQGLRDHGGLTAGQRVLIIGASGGVGTFAVQIAKALGAEVTGVCSTGNVELVRSIGADHVVDYAQDDFTRTGRRYDVILDLVGDRSFADLRHTLEHDGTYVMVSGPKRRWLGPVLRMGVGMLRFAIGSQRFVSFVAKANRKDLVTLAELIEAGRVKPVINATYDLPDAAAALDRIGAGHGRGKTVLTITTESTEV